MQVKILSQRSPGFSSQGPTTAYGQLKKSGRGPSRNPNGRPHAVGTRFLHEVMPRSRKLSRKRYGSWHDSEPMVWCPSRLFYTTSLDVPPQQLRFNVKAASQRVRSTGLVPKYQRSRIRCFEERFPRPSSRVSFGQQSAPPSA